MLTNSGPNNDQLLAMYERMLLIRRMEERLRDDAAAGKLPGAVHLYIGQEACGVGVCAHLDDSDWITGTHRGHLTYEGQCQARACRHEHGGSDRRQMAQTAGRQFSDRRHSL
jgi:TPP-dependent pyruvate/acetoin dehydrogenase alpha subunit